MSVGNILLPVQGIGLPAASYCGIDFSNTSYRLLFDASLEENGYWTFRLPDNYASGATFIGQYAMVSGTSASVYWQVGVMAVSPGDAAGLGTDSFDTANSLATTCPAQATYMGTFHIVLANFDSGAAGDYIKLKFTRGAVHATYDVAVGDAAVYNAVLAYTTI